MEIVMNLSAYLKAAALKELSVDQKMLPVQVNVLDMINVGPKLKMVNQLTVK